MDRSFPRYFAASILVAMLVNRKSPVFQKTFHSCWQHANEDNLLLAVFLLLTIVEEKESILNLNVFGVLGYSFMRLKPSGPSILPGDGSTTPKRKKKRGGRGILQVGWKSVRAKRALGTGSARFWDPPPSSPPPPHTHTYPLHNISTFQTRRAFNSC